MSENFPGEMFKNKKEELTNDEIAEIGRKIITEKENKEKQIVKGIIYKNDIEIKRGEVPTEREITETIRDLIAGNKFEVSREIIDLDKGTILREINIPTKDGHIEYEYMRKGNHGRMKSLNSNISIAYYDKNGMPEGGGIVARYNNGRWRLIT